MNVVLVNPNLDGSPIPNLGLAYILSSIEGDHAVRLLDMSFHVGRYRQYAIEKTEGFRPDAVGFSVTSFTFHHALKIAAFLRERMPGIPFVFGGIHATLLPEETLQSPLVDAVCIGEGEDSFREYLSSVAAGREPRDVAGIWYKDKTGRVVRNALRPFREDLDSIPFPNWDHWEIERYLKTNLYFVGGIGFLFSRGCPYSCTFCSNPAIRRAVPGKFYRIRTPENVIAEIKHNRAKYAPIGFQNVAFGDATFGLDIERLRRFCGLYVQERLHTELPWVCQTRADLITEEWADLVAGAGCCMVTLGIESGNDYIRTEVFRKRMSREAITAAIERLKKRNIMFAINVIFGVPQETRQSVKETMDLLRWADPINTYFSFYQPLPKTELGEMTKERVIVSEDRLTKPWNTPRMPVEKMRLSELKLLMLRIRIVKVWKFLCMGLACKGFVFLATVFKYVFSIGGYRTMSLRNPYMEVDMEQRTFYHYLLEDWKRGYLKRIGARP